VVDTVKEYTEFEAYRGGYEAAGAAKDKIDAVYRSIAGMISCSPDEIASVENATRGWDYIFYSLPFSAGDVVITSETEYGSNVTSFLQMKRSRGVLVEVIPNDPATGVLDVNSLSNAIASIGERAKLVAISHIPTSNGVVHPAEKIGSICREYDIPFLLDACQSVGQLPVDLGQIHCDALTATSRKYLRGPRGQGFLYVNKRGHFWDLEPMYLDVRSARNDESSPTGYQVLPGAIRYENFERSYANWLGMGAAVDYACKWGLDAIERRICFLAETLRRRLEDEVKGTTVTDYGERKCGIVTFTIDGVETDEIKAALAKEKINVSFSQASSTPFDMRKRKLSSVVRASVHYYNSEDEITLLIQGLKRLR